MSLNLKNFLLIIVTFISTLLFISSTTAETKPNTDVTLVSTFHCISIYWSPLGGDSKRKVLVKYRPSGQKVWRIGLPLRYNPINTPECKGNYRGSIVNLRPGTTYEIKLSLEGTAKEAKYTGSTWDENHPVATTIKVTDRNTTLDINKSGKPGAYVLYDGTGCTIDTNNKENIAITVNASYVILRGFTIKNIKKYGIRIFKGQHIIIEDCDISKWGSESEQGWGKNGEASIYSNYKDLSSVVIQRCKIHHPSWNTNNWSQKHGKSKHPAGPQAIFFRDPKGNNVIRYNECWSDKEHYFNDVIGGGQNGSYHGFPGSDSDIYGNYIANSWDDGIEAEGGGENVRIWNNYIEDVLIPIANAAVSIGPLYIWRNVSGRSYSPPASGWNNGPFVKMGHAGGEQWMTGHMYIFNNTNFQKANDGASGLGGNKRYIKHCTTRNNIFHVREGEENSIAIRDKHEDNDFDYDLTSANFPEGHEKNGLRGIPQYLQGAGFDFKTKSGLFQLIPKSKGSEAAIIIPNFCESIKGKNPDIGAHESGAPRIQYGVKAQFNPVESTK